MNKRMRMTMLGLLCGGLLLIGVGTGVAFWEYSTFTYAGLRIPSTAQEETAVLTIPLEHPDKAVQISSYSDELRELLRSTSVQTNEAVLPGTIRVDIAYKAVETEPAFWTTTSEDPAVPDQIYLAWGSRSDLAALMACKDTVLEDFRNHKIGDYQLFYPLAVTVTVHPDDAARVTTKTF